MKCELCNNVHICFTYRSCNDVLNGLYDFIGEINGNNNNRHRWKLRDAWIMDKNIVLDNIRWNYNSLIY